MSLLLVAIWCIIIVQQTFSDLRLAPTGGQEGRTELAGAAWLTIGRLVLPAEAGKKKKKEKSEVVVISVNNAQPKGYGGGMYPIFVPSCGGGHGGFGRRRRR